MLQDINDDKVTSDASLPGVKSRTNAAKTKLEETTSDSTLKKQGVRKKSFLERWKTNRFWLIKGTYYLLHYTWVVVMAIGAFIAWLIALLFI